MMAASALSPILAEVARSFPQESAAAVQMIIVLPGLTSLPFSILAGHLTRQFTKKMLALGAMAIMLLGGSLPLVFHASLLPLLIASAILSIGQGIMVPISSSLISDYFDGDERGVLMGWQSSFVNGGGMIMVILVGFLAKFTWVHAYLVFFLLAPVILAVALFLPNGKINPTANRSEAGVNRTIIYLSVVGFFFNMLFTTYGTNVAMYLASSHLGDATSAGVASSLLTGIGIGAGLIFGKLFRFFRGYTLPLALGLGVVGLLLTFFGGSLWLIFAGGILCGLGISTLMPLGILMAVQAVAPEASAFAIAIFAASTGIGSFVSPLVMNSLAGLTGHSGEKERFLVATFGLLILFVITLIQELRARGQLTRAQI